MSEWYKAVRVEAFVGIRRDDLDPVLRAAGAPPSVFAAVDRCTEVEPLHVELRDAGFTDLNPQQRPLILVLESTTLQIDAGLNEIPRAVAELATGRDGTALAAGAASNAAVSVAHVIERYLGKFTPVRVYARAAVTARAGAPDGELGDFFDEPAEWVVLFEGVTNGTTRRGSPTDYHLVLHMTHFLATLEFSSSLSALVSPGGEHPFALSSSLYRTTIGAQPSGVFPFSSAGYAASGLMGGSALYTDFWGYDVPSEQGLLVVTGLKGFLRELANQDLFDWLSFSTADSNGVFCPDYGRPRKNDRALAALDKIEPFSSAVPRATWKVLKDRMDGAFNGVTAVDRSTLNAPNAVASAYSTVGYRYGVPISFYLQDAALGVFASQTAFAADLAMASLNTLAPSSFWDLLVGQYAGRYQLALAPMSNKAVVIPFQPILDGSWQTVYASEVSDWNDDVRNTTPVRGVVMVAERKSDTGWFTSGVLGSNSANGVATSDAVYDSCEDGVFVYRALPAWMASAFRVPATWFGKSVATTARAQASVPWTTATAAAAIVPAVAAAVPGAAELTLAQVFTLLGTTPATVTTPTEANRSTANRMARALFQQTRTSPHSIYVTGRFRYDIGPGSVVSLELPADRYVRGALVGARDTRATGMVLRMTISISREQMQAVTAFQIGFVRLEAETRPGHVLYSGSHPFWRTAVYGVPWADCAWIRNRLGARADINTRVPGVG